MPERAESLQTPDTVKVPAPRLKPAAWSDGGDAWVANTHDADLSAIPAGASKSGSEIRFPKAQFATEDAARAALGRLYPQLADSAANPDGTYNLYNRMLFSEGVWNGDKYNAADMHEMVRAHNEIGAELRPWAALGHDPAQNYAKSHGLPRVGTLAALRVGPHEKDPSKTALYGDILNVPEPVYRSVEQKGYPTRSPEIYHNLNWNGRVFPRVMRAVALLGTEEAGNPTLPDLFRSYDREQGIEGDLRVYTFKADDEDVHDSLTPQQPSTPDEPERLARVQRAYAARAGKLVQGLPLRITHPKGSIRTGTDKQGRPWQRPMSADYASVPGTVAPDGDALDVYLGPQAETADTVHVVKQVDPQTGEYDEDKAMIGWPDLLAARDAYLAHMPDPAALGGIASVSLSDWIAGALATRPGGYRGDNEGVGAAQPQDPHEAPDLTQAAQKHGAQARLQAKALEARRRAVQAIAGAAAPVFDYSFNPSQPRAADGKWTSAGDQAAHHALKAIGESGLAAVAHQITAHLALAKHHLLHGEKAKHQAALDKAYDGVKQLRQEAKAADQSGDHTKAHTLYHLADHYGGTMDALGDGKDAEVAHHNGKSPVSYVAPGKYHADDFFTANHLAGEHSGGVLAGLTQHNAQGIAKALDGKNGLAAYHFSKARQELDSLDPAKLSAGQKAVAHAVATKLGHNPEKFAFAATAPSPAPERYKGKVLDKQGHIDATNAVFDHQGDTPDISDDAWEATQHLHLGHQALVHHLTKGDPAEVDVAQHHLDELNTTHLPPHLQQAAADLKASVAAAQKKANAPAPAVEGKVLDSEGHKAAFNAVLHHQGGADEPSDAEWEATQHLKMGHQAMFIHAQSHIPAEIDVAQHHLDELDTSHLPAHLQQSAADLKSSIAAALNPNAAASAPASVPAPSHAPHLDAAHLPVKQKEFVDVRRARAAYHAHAIQQALEKGDGASYDHHLKLLGNVAAQLGSERDNAKAAGDIPKYAALLANTAHVQGLVKAIKGDYKKGGLSDSTKKMITDLGAVGSPLKATPAGILEPIIPAAPSVSAAPVPPTPVAPTSPAPKEAPTPAHTPITGLSVVPHGDVAGTLTKSGLGGSNGAAMYEGKDGKKYVVKTYSNSGQAYGEHVSNVIYASLGIPVPQTHLTDLGAHASEVVDGTAGVNPSSMSKDEAKEFLKGYAADVLLGNRDVIGTGGGGGDNLLRGKDGKIYRIDNGGSLLYYAMQGKKGKDAIENLHELDGFSQKNPQYKAILAKAGYKDWTEIPGIEGQMKQAINALSGDAIDKLTAAHTGVPESERAEMKEALTKRRDGMQAALDGLSKKKAEAAANEAKQKLALAALNPVLSQMPALKSQDGATISAAFKKGLTPHHTAATAYAQAQPGFINISQRGAQELPKSADEVKALAEGMKAHGAGSSAAKLQYVDAAALAKKVQENVPITSFSHAVHYDDLVKPGGMFETGFIGSVLHGHQGKLGDNPTTTGKQRRINIEQHALGIWDVKHGPHTSTIYGTLHPMGEAGKATSYHNDSYGSIKLVAHPRVLDRAVFHQGDTWSKDQWHQKAPAGPVSQATKTAAQADMLNKAEALTTHAAVGGYMEALPVGGMSFEDIHEIHAPDQAMADKIRQQLDARGHKHISVYIGKTGQVPKLHSARTQESPK